MITGLDISSDKKSRRIGQGISFCSGFRNIENQLSGVQYEDSYVVQHEKADSQELEHNNTKDRQLAWTASSIIQDFSSEAISREPDWASAWEKGF